MAATAAIALAGRLGRTFMTAAAAFQVGFWTLAGGLPGAEHGLLCY
jgi:hypothetical protein